MTLVRKSVLSLTIHYLFLQLNNILTNIRIDFSN
uniref:Uncharacterized protein n=1 Tax=Arundo donax TaxID=35708 RepID=A0A0A9CJC3_ARUDO